MKLQLLARLLRKQQAKFFTRYLLPILAVFLALEANWAMASYVSFLPPFLAFLAAIMVTTWYGGFSSGVFAVILSTVITDYYFIPPIFVFSVKPGDIGTMGVFVLEAMIMAYCIDYLRMNEHRLRRTNLDLEHQVSSKHLELSDKGEKLRGIISQLANTEERERRQLATELHDYLAQLLTLARMKINQADQHAYRSAGDSHRYMRETDDLLRKSMEYVRTLMAELHPTQLYQSGLPAALRWLVEQMPRHGLTVDLSISSESLPLTSDNALLLYLSVRELLMNIVKHAAVNRALVTVDVASECVLITVQDSGQGFNPSALPQTTSGHHLGLQSVRERVAAIGGKIEVQSRVGKGATITLTVPTHPLSASEEVRAASPFALDRVRVKSATSDTQQSLPL